MPNDVDPEVRGRASEDDGDDEDYPYLRQLEEGSRFSEYLKFSGEGATSLQELASLLRSLAEWVLTKEAEGFVLESPVEDGHVEIVSPDLVPSD